MAKTKQRSSAKPAARRTGAARNGHAAVVVGPDLEEELVRLAESGRLAGAGRAAVRADRAAGLPVTYQRGSQVVREYPDGRREVLGTIPPTPPYKLPKSARRLRSA
jgi:hypothetical protein